MIKSPIQLDPTKKKRLEKVLGLMKGGNSAILNYLLQIEERLDNEIPKITDVVSRVKGEKGDKPVPGKDYPLPQPGKDGYTPKKGKDYKDGENYILTEKDKGEIAKKVKVPVVEKIIREIPVVKEKETIIKEPLAVKFSPQELRDLLELLTGEERIDARSIRGLEELIRLNPGNGPMLHTPSIGNLPDVNIVGITVGQILVWNGTYFQPGNNSGGGGSDTFYNDIVSGTINGSNRTFTVPNSIGSAINLVLANSSYQEGVDYTFSGNTITMSFAPDASLSGQPFWFAYTTSTSILTETVSGTINGSNRTFTVPTAIITPIQLVLANSIYQNGVDYTASGTTITFTTAPDSSLVGQPFWMVHT